GSDPTSRRERFGGKRGSYNGFPPGRGRWSDRSQLSLKCPHPFLGDGPLEFGVGIFVGCKEFVPKRGDYNSRRALHESKAQRLWPRPMPRIPAFRRSALSVRFILLAISERGVRAFECALSSRTSSLVHGVRWAEVFFFGTDCCSGKGSRLRATPVARLTTRAKEACVLGVLHGRSNFPANAPS